MSTQLPPGNYFIELAFRRQVSEETLARALTVMGFTNIEFDKNEDVAVGGLPAGSITPTTGTSTTVRVPTTTAVKVPVVVVSTISVTDRQTVLDLASKGAAIAVKYVEVTAARNKNASPSYRFGFDVATALCEGKTLPGPGQDAMRVLSSKIDPSPATIEGFNVGQLLQHNIAKGTVKVTVTPVTSRIATTVTSTTATAKSTTTLAKPSGLYESSSPSPVRSPAPAAYTPSTPASLPSTSGPSTSLAPQTEAEKIAAYEASCRTSTCSALLPGQQYPGGPAASNRGSAADANNFATRERVPDPIAEQEEAEYRRMVAEAEAQAAQKVPQGLDEPYTPPVYRESPPGLDQAAQRSADPATGLLKKLAEDMSQSMVTSVPDRWKRWVEWGSPFATSAAYLTNVSGEEEADITRFRFVAQLTKTLAPQNLPDMSWVFIRRLSLDPFKDLTFQLTPFKLQRNGLYEFRFFSRMKSNPTKESVKETLAKMGFSPMKLNLLKKNMRIPRRGNVSVCMWLGIGRWTAPNSMVTSEDPFFFESLREVSP